MNTMAPAPDDDNEDDDFDASFDENDLIPRPDTKAWKPTVNDPFPHFRCTHIKKNGERCELTGIVGMMPDNAKCSFHGGKNPSVVEKAKSRVDAARMKILDNADHAADVLQSLTLEGTADNIRLKAATEILDRAGIRGGVEIDLSGDIEINSAAEVRERLARLALGQIEDDEDIVDAEVVDEDGEDDTDEEKSA